MLLVLRASLSLDLRVSLSLLCHIRTMADAALKEPIEDIGETRENLPSGIDEVAAIPKGTIDPVYEAKARVLNHAVRSSLPCRLDRLLCNADTFSDSRNWHGMVPVAAFHSCWFRLGQRQFMAHRNIFDMYEGSVWPNFDKYSCNYC